MNLPTQLPVIDISAFDSSATQAAAIAMEVRRALEHSGFMYVQGHGIDRNLRDETFATARRFFASPQAFKDQFAYRDIAANFGFQGLRAERLDPASPPDLKEAFTMRNAAALAGTTQHWPDAVFRDSILAFYDVVVWQARRLLQILANCLKLPADFFDARHRGDNITLRLLHYPANLAIDSMAQLGAGAHTDYGSITLLFQDNVGGLELRDANGTWQLAPPVPDAIVINTGDLMERWSNGRFRSTLHRVRPVSGASDRYSIALFVDPDSEIVVDPLAGCITEDQPARYPPVTAGDYIRRKIAATHG